MTFSDCASVLLSTRQQKFAFGRKGAGGIPGLPYLSMHVDSHMEPSSFRSLEESVGKPLYLIFR